MLKQTLKIFNYDHVVFKIRTTYWCDWIAVNKTTDTKKSQKAIMK